MDESFLKEAALRYLNDINCFSSLRKQCLEFMKSPEITVYKFNIKIMCMDLADVSTELADLVLHKPMEGVKIFRDVITSSVSKSEFLPKNFISRLFVNLRLDGFPSVGSYKVENLKDVIHCLNSGHYVSIKGVLLAMTNTTKYTFSMTYKCSNRDSEGSQDSKYIRFHAPGAPETQIVRNDFICNECGLGLVEDVSQRVLADKLTGWIANESNVFRTKNSSFSCQNIPVIFRDDLAADLKIGKIYSIIGLPIVTRQDNLAVGIEANNCEVCPRQQELGESHPSLHNDWSSTSPWSIGIRFAYMFADDVIRPDSWIRLKLGIILNLLTESPTSLLVMAEDSLIASRLLQYGCSLSANSVIHTYTKSVIGDVKDKHDGNYTVEGGSLILAQNGVCYVGDISLMTKSKRDAIFRVLDTGEIVIDGNAKIKSYKCPLECKIWACVEPNTVSKKTRLSNKFGFQKRNDARNSLIDVFSMILVPDKKDVDDPFTELYFESRDSAPESWNQLKQMVTTVSSKSVLFTHEAESLVRRFYDSSRSTKKCGNVGRPHLPPSALSTIAVMAEAHAKLNFRDQVIVPDALMAILLFEESIAARYGFSSLDVQSLNYSHALNLESFCEQIDRLMNEFHDRLVRFIANNYESEE